MWSCPLWWIMWQYLRGATCSTLSSVDTVFHECVPVWLTHASAYLAYNYADTCGGHRITARTEATRKELQLIVDFKIWTDIGISHACDCFGSGINWYWHSENSHWIWIGLQLYIPSTGKFICCRVFTQWDLDLHISLSLSFILNRFVFVGQQMCLPHKHPS